MKTFAKYLIKTVAIIAITLAMPSLAFAEDIKDEPHTHLFNELVEINKDHPTCISPYVTFYKCACGTEDVISRTETFGEHQFASKHVEGSCTQGSLDIEVCSVCGLEGKRANETKPTGHNFKWSVTKEPTSKETGIETGICSVCNVSEQRVLPMVQPSNEEVQAKKAEEQAKLEKEAQLAREEEEKLVREQQEKDEAKRQAREEQEKKEQEKKEQQEQLDKKSATDTDKEEEKVSAADNENDSEKEKEKEKDNGFFIKDEDLYFYGKVSFIVITATALFLFWVFIGADKDDDDDDEYDEQEDLPALDEIVAKPTKRVYTKKELEITQPMDCSEIMRRLEESEKENKNKNKK
ncbi:MAG: hypothetical protein RR702_06770 [Clostridia bacterium]